MSRPAGYWEDWNNFTRELYPVIENEYKDQQGSVIKPANVFPTQAQLKKIGRVDLQTAMSRHYGGSAHVKEKLSLPINPGERGRLPRLTNEQLIEFYHDNYDG
ncbi:MAG TPA: hypothetical protein ACFYEL_10175, partial [Candidatus Wunengus californicus]